MKYPRSRRWRGTGSVWMTWDSQFAGFRENRKMVWKWQWGTRKTPTPFLDPVVLKLCEKTDCYQWKVLWWSRSLRAEFDSSQDKTSSLKVHVEEQNQHQVAHLFKDLVIRVLKGGRNPTIYSEEIQRLTRTEGYHHWFGWKPKRRRWWDLKTETKWELEPQGKVIQKKPNQRKVMAAVGS